MFIFSSKTCPSHGFSKNCAYVLLACMNFLYTIGTLCTYVRLFWRGHDVLDAALVKGGGKDSQNMNNFYWLSDLLNLKKVVPVYMNDVPVQNFNCYSQIFDLITYTSYIWYESVADISSYPDGSLTWLESLWAITQIGVGLPKAMRRQ